ncbi:hypothetical protein G7Y89_g12936 [Cudoniella acicularis]|uniref:2EXR domain-containing protein n=1 Tax=Cudoniella acicularis TaxID=354080 RepID=A0A8H4RBP0_9HELO|nr:hypothetical protein G7Y89_g12936 [Cudoniella acicularis]
MDSLNPFWNLRSTFEQLFNKQWIPGIARPFNMASASFALIRTVVQAPKQLFSGLAQLTRPRPLTTTPHESTVEGNLHGLSALPSSQMVASTKRNLILSSGSLSLEGPSSQTVLSGEPGEYHVPNVEVEFRAGFPKFPQLPTELRLRIWYYALHEPRIVEVLASFNHYPAFYRDSIITKIPSLFHVNHEAREAAVKTFQVKQNTAGFQFLEPQYLVNHKCDTLFISQESMVVDILQTIGKEERNKIRSLGVSQNWWCNVSVGQHVFERSVGPIYLNALEELVVLAVPRSEKGRKRQLTQRVWFRELRNADEVDASWRNMSRIMEEEWKQEQWQSTMNYRNWMNARRCIESLWKELCEQKGVVKKLRIVRGVVDDANRSGGFMAFVKCEDMKKQKLRKTRKVHDSMTGRDIWVL